MEILNFLHMRHDRFVPEITNHSCRQIRLLLHCKPIKQSRSVILDQPLSRETLTLPKIQRR